MGGLIDAGSLHLAGVDCLEHGYFLNEAVADVVACDGDPLREMRSLRQTRFVMKGGRTVRFDQR